jgi:hypothetical protein
MIQKQKQKLNYKENQRRMYKNQKLPSSKKGNKRQASLASEQTGLGQGVW